MNEMKPEDVMKALELQVQRHLMQNVDIDGTVSVEDAERWFLKLLKEKLAPYVSALLREKDAKIAELQSIAEFQQSSNMKRHFELQEKDKQIKAKDAEIERLKKEHADYVEDVTAMLSKKHRETERLMREKTALECIVSTARNQGRAEAVSEFIYQANGRFPILAGITLKLIGDGVLHSLRAKERKEAADGSE